MSATIDDTIRVDMGNLTRDILALFPEGVPLNRTVQIRKIMMQMGMLCGIIDALQQTAGEVFAEHAKGNSDIAAMFYEALLAISVPHIPKK